MAEVYFEIKGSLVTRHEETLENLRDGSARLVRTSQTKHLEDWFEELRKQEPSIQFSPYLVGARWLGQATWGDKTAVAVECPPEVRKIATRFDGGRLYELAFSYVILGFRFSGTAVDAVQVFYRNQPVTNLEDRLGCPNLPNIYEAPKCNVCTGFKVDVRLSLPERVETLVEAFWASEFNNDLAGNHWGPSKSIAGHPKKFSEWEEMSKADSSFILKIVWRETGWTMSDLLRKGVGL